MSHAPDNGRRTEQTIRVRADGSADIDHAITVWGGGAAGVRYRFQSPEQRVERLTSAFGDVFPGVEVDEVEAPTLGDILEPAKLTAKLAVPTWAARDGEAMRFFVLGRDSRLTQAMAATAEREHDLVLDLPSTEVYEIDYTLPAGHTFSRTPGDKSIDTPVGKFTLRVTSREGGAHVESKLELLEARITPDQYEQFRQFLRQVDASLEQRFEVSRAR